jgi:hypothetical protein
MGWEVSLPVSKQFRDVYLHWNAGFTNWPSARADGAAYDLLTPRVAGSAIWRARSMVNVMLEALAEWQDQIEGRDTRHERVVTMSPGVRFGWNRGDTQTVLGLALPITNGGHATNVGSFFYFSCELPFAH